MQCFSVQLICIYIVSFPFGCQMSAYYAPAFFGYLLGKCLRRKNPVIEVAKLGLAVLGTFAVVWWPYLYSVDASLEVNTHVFVFCPFAFLI